jgi:outer membrane receptor protein involved in Fe transport
MITDIRSTVLRVSRPGTLLAMAAAGLMFSISAGAQDQETDDIFEEIVVVAQKREQNIMEVPVAVTAVTGAQIQASGIKDIFDLQQNVPSLIVGQSQSSTTSFFQIRSVGSTSNNFGVESSVGLYVDGVYRSRQSSMINDLIDIEAVEVLRGPQGTLFGKNTPSGAVTVRSVRPSQDADAFVEATAGDLGLVKFSAAANIPIGDSIALRGTFFSTERDGYVDDFNFGEDVHNDRDRRGVRLQLANDASEDLNWRLIADYAEIDETCCVAVSRVDNIISRASDLTDPTGAGLIFGTDFSIFLLGGTVFTDYPYPPGFLESFEGLPVCDPVGFPCFFGPSPGRILPGGTFQQGLGFDDYTSAASFLPESSNEDKGLSFEFNNTFDNGMTFTSISAYRAFDSFDFVDIDFTDAPVLERINDATQDSFSQEFRLAGEFGTGHNYVLGAYYFEQEIVNQKTTNDAGLTALLLATDSRVVAIQDIVNLVAANFGAAGYQPAGFPPVLPGSNAFDVTTQNHDSWAVFAQTDLAFGDDFVLTLGARYTDEQKDVDAVYTSAPLPTGTPRPDFTLVATLGCSLDPTCAPLLPPGSPVFNPLNPTEWLADFQPLFSPGWGVFGFDPLAPRDPLSDSLSDDQVTGTAKLTWFPSDTTMLYASYATGYKSGGTNDDRISPAFEQVFGPETSESVEIGFKGDLGPVRLSVAIYDTQYEDFQSNSFTGTGFNLQNAGDLDTQGFEVEFIWRPFESTEIQGYYAKNEGEYDSFENGTCRDAFVFHTQMDDPGLQPESNPVLEERCDRSGDVLPYNPEDQVFVAVTQDLEIGDDTMYFRGEFSHFSEAFTDGDVDPFTRQDSVDLVNLRIGYIFTDLNAELTLWGRNITDERYYVGSFDAPAQEGHMNSYPSEPSTFGITFRKNFD